MDPVRLKLFGGLEARRDDGARLALPTRKAALLLAFLALAPGRAQPRDKLIGLLWGSRGEEQARSSLRHALSALRKALGGDAILAERDAVAVDPGAVASDVAAFEALMADATPAALERAAALYDGDLLDGYAVAEPAFQDWLSFEQARLHELARRAFDKLLAHQVAAGDPTRAIATARRLLAFDPLQEEVHRTLMRLYLDDGQRGLALEQYHSCRRLLAEELGIRPEAETEALLRELRRPAAPRRSAAVAGATAAVAAAATGADPDPGVADGEAEAADAAAEEELRPATIAFLTVIPGAQGTAAPDSEDWHGLRRRFLDAAAQTAARYGGALEPGLGDCAMLTFGVSRAHHDDAERALHAAAEMHQAAASLSRETGHKFAAQVGLAGGLVLSGQGGGQAPSLSGDAVNLAAQLSAAACPGETLIPGELYRGLGHILRTERGAPLPRKGGGRLETWSVRELRGPAPAASATPLIGRQGELRQLDAALDGSLEAGAGQVLYLRGAAGVGKSRLVGELTARAKRRGFTCHEALVLDFGATQAQGPVRTLVRCLAGVTRRDAAPLREAAAEQALAEGLVAPEQRAFLNDLLDLPQPAETRSLYDALDEDARLQGKYATLAAMVRGAARTGPLLLAVDDIQWADAPTLACLAHLAAAIGDLSVVLVLTARLEDDPLDQAWRQAALGSAFLTLDLGPLNRTQARALADSYPNRAEAIVERCIERAQGNPMFLEQLLLHAEDGGAERLPGTLQSLVTARVDRLPPRDKQALQAASAIGQRFSLEVLRSLLDAPDYRCTELVAHQLVRPAGPDFLFTHDLIRDGVYRALVKSRRQALHLKAAAWYRTRDPQMHAEHLERAGDPRAASAYYEAARKAFAEYRFVWALDLVHRGLALCRDAAERSALSLLEGDIRQHEGAMQDSIAAYARALESAADDTGRCRASIGLAAAMRVIDDYDGALRALDDAQALAQAAGLTTELSRIHSLRGNLYFPLGRISRCREQHALALKYARRIKSPEAEAQALSGLGDVDYAQGRMMSAIENFRRCIALCRRHGFGRIEVANRHMIAGQLFYLNDLGGALESGLEAIEAARRVGHQRAEIVARTVVGQTYLELGDFAAAGREIEASQDLVRRLGAWRFAAENLYVLAIAAMAEGRRAEARAMLREALEIAERSGFTYVGPIVLGVLGWVASDRATRLEALGRGESALGPESISHNHLWFYRYALQAALDLHDWPRVERYAAALEAYTRAQPLPWATFHIARARALSEVGRGRCDVETLERLRGLRAEAEEVGYRLALPEIETALAAAAKA